MEILLPLIVPVFVLALAGQAEGSKGVKVAVVLGGAFSLLLGLLTLWIASSEKGDLAMWMVLIAVLNGAAFMRSRNV